MLGSSLAGPSRMTGSTRRHRRCTEGIVGITRIATASNADGRLELFAIGTDGALNHNWQTSPGGNWSGWNGLAGSMTKIATAANSDGRIEVFRIGRDTQLYHNWQN